MIDWGFAIQVAAGGFGMVFFLLVVLSIVVWATSRAILWWTRNKTKPQA